jgi:ribosomal protein S6
MKRYETVVVFDAALNDAQVQEEVKKISDLLTQQGATEVRATSWGRRDLSFRMHGKRLGFYYSVEFSFDHMQASGIEGNAGERKLNIVDELQRVLFINDNVLRFQTILSSVRERRFKGNLKRISTGGFDSDDDRSDSYF